MQEAKSDRLSSHYPVVARSGRTGLDAALHSLGDFEQGRV